MNMNKEQALRYLRTWARWSEPTEYWVRKTLVRTGTARPDDTVTHSMSTMHIVPEHEKAAVAVLRRLCRIAGAERLDLVHSVSRCGDGKIDKRAARVVIKLDSAFSDDDFFVRLDIDCKEAREALSRKRVG